MDANSPFQGVKPTKAQAAAMELAAEQYELLRIFIKENTKVGRYQSIALTALEESAMWLNKSVCHDAL